MSKEIYHSSKKTNAIINETKYQILMRLFYRDSEFISGVNFKSLQDDLKLCEVYIDKNRPAFVVSDDDFMRSVDRAEKAGWIHLKRHPTAEDLFEVGLTPKGEQIAQKEWEILCSKN